MIQIKLSDREGLRSFLRFASMGGPLDYYEELLRAGRVFTVTKMTRTHFEIDDGLYRLNKANFWRYFSEQETDEKTIKAVRSGECGTSSRPVTTIHSRENERDSEG